MGDGEARETVAAPVRAARWSVSAVFAVHGAVAGTFAARVPWLADHVGVEVGGLGVALLMPGIGAVLATLLSGRLVHRHDHRTLVRATLPLWCGSLALPALPSSLAWLCPALIVFGATSGFADVAMNAQAVLVEKRYGRSVMSSVHGCWSTGVLLGSGVSAAAERTHLDARIHFCVAGVVLALCGQLATRRLLPHRPEPEVEEPPAFAIPSRALLVIGLVGLCAVFAESASQDWSAVFVHTRLGEPTSIAALAVSTFACCMAVARILGDQLVHRVGPVTAVRLCALCATLGGLVVVLSRDVVVVIAGFGLLGVGVSIVVPLVFAAAGRAGGDHPGHGLAAVASLSYGAGLVVPGVVGGIAHLTSLAVSFGVVTVLTVVMGLGARVVG